MVYLNIDKYGRIVLPKNVREEMETDGFEMTIEKKGNAREVRLRPTKKFSDLLGMFPDLDMKKIRKEHSEENKRDNSG